MAGLIKSAISKQRSTSPTPRRCSSRNPEGIGDALKIIDGHSAGTFVETARRRDVAPVFRSGEHRLSTAFATIPR